MRRVTILILISLIFLLGLLFWYLQTIPLKGYGMTNVSQSKLSSINNNLFITEYKLLGNDSVIFFETDPVLKENGKLIMIKNYKRVVIKECFIERSWWQGEKEGDVRQDYNSSIAEPFQFCIILSPKTKKDNFWFSLHIIRENHTVFFSREDENFSYISEKEIKDTINCYMVSVIHPIGDEKIDTLGKLVFVKK